MKCRKNIKWKSLFLVILAMPVIGLSQALPANDDPRLTKLEGRVAALALENKKLRAGYSELLANSKTDSVAIVRLGEELATRLPQLKMELDSLATKVEQKHQANATQINQVDDALSQRSLYGIIGILSALLAAAGIFMFLRSKQKSDKTALLEELAKTRTSISEDLVAEFGKQTELLQAQMKLMEERKGTSSPTKDVEPDHSFALKVAKEINLMERNLGLMDPSTRGIKQLRASMEKLRENLSANGYEITRLIGTKFRQGTKMIVSNSFPDDSLEAGEELISKVLVPEVVYRDKVIQVAEVELSVGN